MSEEEFVREELQKAETALKDAETLLKAGGSDPAVFNRLYYACYHSAKTFLYSRGEDPSTHSGLVKRFSQLLKNEEEGRRKGSFLARMRTLREKADYEYEEIEEEINEIKEKTEDFMKFVEQRIEVIGSEEK